MRAAERLRDHVVDELEPMQPLGRDAHGLRRELRLVGALPENAGAAFGRDHRVVAVFENQHAVGHADAERAAGAAFADDGGNNRHFQQRHLAEIHRNGFGNVAFLRRDAGERARGVNERDDGQAELVREARLDALDLDHAVQRVKERTADRYAVRSHPELEHKLEVLSSTEADVAGIWRWLDAQSELESSTS